MKRNSGTESIVLPPGYATDSVYVCIIRPDTAVLSYLGTLCSAYGMSRPSLVWRL